MNRPGFFANDNSAQEKNCTALNGLSASVGFQVYVNLFEVTSIESDCLLMAIGKTTSVSNLDPLEQILN